MKYFFHPEAEKEFINAINYYEECEQGLGFNFALEVQFTIQNILSFPNAWPTLENNIRRCQTRRFPYGIIYTIDENLLFILAIMHLHRDPEYWKDRS